MAIPLKSRELLNNRNWLYSQYSIKNIPTPKIAHEVKVSQTTIKTYLKKHNIPRKGVSKEILTKLHNQLWMTEQYVSKGRTTICIGKELGISSETVGFHLKKHKIKIRGKLPNHVQVLLNNKAWLEEQYKTKSFEKIASDLGTQSGYICRVFKKHGIQSKPCGRMQLSPAVEELLTDGEWLREQYKTLNASQIAKNLGVGSATTIMVHLKKHNIEIISPYLSKEIISLLDNRDWFQGQYKTKSLQTIASDLQISISTVHRYLHKHKIKPRHPSLYSEKAIIWIESISEKNKVFIQHAGNIGEYRIPKTRLSVDGFCKETNTIFEFYGDVFHGNPDIFDTRDYCHPYRKITAGKLYSNTLEREQKIISLGYKLVTIWEKDYDESIRS